MYSLHLMGHGPARSTKLRGDGPRPGPAHNFLDAETRPGPIHHFFEVSRPGLARPAREFFKIFGPARPITFSKYSVRRDPPRFSDRSGPARTSGS